MPDPIVFYGVGDIGLERDDPDGPEISADIPILIGTSKDEATTTYASAPTFRSGTTIPRSEIWQRT